MKYCVYCGTSVTENYKFCPNCGKIIQPEGAEIEETTSAASAPSEETTSIQEELVSVDAAESVEEAKTETTQIPVSEAPVQEKSSKSLIGIACAVVGLLILAIVVFAVVVMLQQNKDDSSVQSTGDNVESYSLTLSEYVSEYNETLRRTVSSPVNTHVSDSNYISCAKTLINKTLKNPSTAQYNSASVYDKDDYGRAIVLLDVSAQNGFGGWVRDEYYVCIQSYDRDGTFTYNSIFPYVNNISNIDSLLIINDFGVDHAAEELEGILFDFADFVNEGTSFEASPSQSLNCYKLVFNYGIQFVYVDANTNKVVSVQTAFTNTSGHTSDCEKICAASVAALTGTSMSTAKESIANVMSLSSFSPTSTPTFFNEGFVYDCAYGFSGVVMTVTVASEDSYKSDLYWSPNKDESIMSGTTPDNNQGNRDAGDSVGSSENVSNPSNNDNASYSANWKAEYADVLDNTMIEYPNYQYSCNYALYDIDENGVPEMFIKVGTGEADYIYRVYAMSEAADGAVLIDTLSAGHTSVCGLQTKGSFLLHGGHMGYEWISKVTLSNNRFTEELIFETEVVNYHELKPIDTYELNDRSGLNWSGNLPENNQQILDAIL